MALERVRVAEAVLGHAISFDAEGAVPIQKISLQQWFLSRVQFPHYRLKYPHQRRPDFPSHQVFYLR